MMYCGIMTTCVGSINVSSIIANSVRLSGNSSRANANAVSEQARTFPTTAPAQTTKELM